MSHEEIDPHVGRQLVYTSAGEKFSFNRFHRDKISNALLPQAICWGGTSSLVMQNWTFKKNSS
jgi:hypothetical protein